MSDEQRDYGGFEESVKRFETLREWTGLPLKDYWQFSPEAEAKIAWYDDHYGVASIAKRYALGVREDGELVLWVEVLDRRTGQRLGVVNESHPCPPLC